MTIIELGKKLNEMYNTPGENKVAMIHLFGIKYADIIQANRYTPREILEIAEMPVSYVAEINKGIKLSKYVNIKEKYK